LGAPGLLASGQRYTAALDSFHKGRRVRRGIWPVSQWKTEEKSPSRDMFAMDWEIWSPL
jgi:hypothetical protein